MKTERRRRRIEKKNLKKNLLKNKWLKHSWHDDNYFWNNCWRGGWNQREEKKGWWSLEL